MVDHRHGAGRRRYSRRSLLHGMTLFGGLALAGCSLGESGPGELLAWPADDRWPDQFHEASLGVQEAYRYAVANPDDLKYIPCFCGCGPQGHASVGDCYVREFRGDGSVLLDPMSFG